MTIETKYSTTQECWLIHDNKVQKMQIVAISITIRSGCKDEVNYLLHNSSVLYSQDSIFETKEELLKSL
jgi:hypothetical protein